MHFQLIIIGSGPGGYRTAEYAASKGLQVAIIEKDQVGGTCLNRGCIPTKTLCHEAEQLSVLQRAIPSANVNYALVHERMDEVIAQLRAGVEQLLAQPGIILLRGEAHFCNAKTVSVSTTDTDGNPVQEELTADDIIIATGSLPKLPPGLQLPDPDTVMSSTQLLQQDAVPHRLCIVGAGVIGMEMACVMARFGAEVTVLEFLKECLPPVDADIAKRLRKALEKQGIHFTMQAAVKAVHGNADGTRTVVYEDKRGKRCETIADAVLMATGRRPATDGLNLEATAVELGRGGAVVVDQNMQTTVPHLYAIGDVNGRQMLAHAATMQGMRTVNHILQRAADGIRLDVMPAAIFTLPECACVGVTEQQAEAEGIGYECRKSFYRASGKALAMQQTEGMVKLLSEKDSGRIIGCHVYGAHAADLVQEVSALMCLDATVSQLAAITHIHPTLSELLQDAALSAAH